VSEDQTNENAPAVAESPVAPAEAETSSSVPSAQDGSLGIGSLKGDIRHE
jgi:putative iron-dependent peroxidase